MIAPLLDIAPVGGALDLDGAQGLLFTSANGVEQFAARSPERGLPAFCVGAMTAEAARRAGFSARSADGDVAALAALAIAAHRPGGGPFVHVRGRHAAGDLTGRLKAAGVPARAAEIYAQVPRPLAPEAAALLAAGGVRAVALFSPRSARLFAAAVRDGGMGPRGRSRRCRSAPPSTRRSTGSGFGARIVAEAPTREGMIAALARV